METPKSARATVPGMTTVAVLADPPESGAVLSDLVPSPLSAEEAAVLYTAALADVCAAVERSGETMLVNYRSPGDGDADDAEAAVRDAVTDALAAPGEARFEVQVGSTRSARIGNTITHLLETEASRTAAVVTPETPFLARGQVDGAAMKLRSSEVVLGPTTDGRIYYAGFSEPVDFEDALATPEVETLVERARDAGLSVDFLPTLPAVRTPTDLRTAVPRLRAGRAAERIVPERTGDVVEALGLRVVAGDEPGAEPTVVRD